MSKEIIRIDERRMNTLVEGSDFDRIRACRLCDGSFMVLNQENKRIRFCSPQCQRDSDRIAAVVRAHEWRLKRKLVR